MREVPTIILPSLGSRFYRVVRDIGVAGYVSPYVTKLGVRQADEQLKIEAAGDCGSRLRGEVGKGYFEVESKV